MADHPKKLTIGNRDYNFIGGERDLGDLAKFNIRHHAGYAGMFTRDQSPVAKFENGARVMKVLVDASGDNHPVGSKGTVLGSIGHPAVGAAYFVEWDASPGVASLCCEAKVERSQ